MIKIRENINILDILKSIGWSQYQLRKNKVMGVGRIQRLRVGCVPSWKELDWICRVSGYNVGDLIEFTSDDLPSVQYIPNYHKKRKKKPIKPQKTIRPIKQLSYRGETKSISEWANQIGCSYIVLYQRIRLGWTDEEIITTPILRKK